MNNDNRNYAKWLGPIKAVGGWVIRHDVDFDINMAHKMLEVERNVGVRSITYLDVHSPSYTLNDIVFLCNYFHDDGFKFGLHINTAYDNDKNAAIKQYIEDVKLLRDNGIEVHSCVGHLYNAKYLEVPEFSNVTIELDSLNYSDVPSFWEAFCLNRNHTMRIIDSSCYLHSSVGPIDNLGDIIIKTVNSPIGYIQTHPVNFYLDELGNVIFAKRLGNTPYDYDRLCKIVRELNVTPYLAKPINEIEHLKLALDMIVDYANTNYRKLVRVLDVGCGIGQLGIPLMHFNNIKYMGIDIDPNFIANGNKMSEHMNYGLDLRVGDLYDPKFNHSADIFVMLATDDCYTDYGKLYEICKNYDNVIITTPTEELYNVSKIKGKHYYYIDPLEFLNIFGETFNVIRNSIVRSRHFYWLRKKS